MADVTTAGPALAGRERVRADRTAGERYRTFPARLPAVLAAIAGGVGILGALGAGIRATAIETVQDDPEQVRVLMGHAQATGWILAVVALLLAVSALAWVGKRAVLRSAAAAITIAFIVLSALRLSGFERTAADWAQAALRSPDFAGYHAGLGWGAWMLLTAAVVASFALLVGALRVLDLRKGIDG